MSQKEIESHLENNESHINFTTQDIHTYSHLAFQSKNILLLEYISQLCRLENVDESPVSQELSLLLHELNSKPVLRWFDTKTLNQSPDIHIRDSSSVQLKIEETLKKIERVSRGGLAVCVVIPTLNEERYLHKLLDSIHEQKTDYPVMVVISDNNSEDQTLFAAKEHGANSVIEATRGIGPARQAGIDYVRRLINLNHRNVIVIQLDADELLPDKLFIQQVCSAYEKDTALMASVGPIEYSVQFAGQKTMFISGGKQFREMFDTFSIKEMFGLCGRSIDDYLLGPPYRFFAGGNSVYRLSIFDNSKIEFPKDKSWESVEMSIQVQQELRPDQIMFFSFQTVQSSVRAFSDEEGVTSEHYVEDIKKKGYIPPFRSKDSLSPLITLQQIIRRMDEHTYSLSKFDEILGVFVGSPESIAAYPFLDIQPVQHAATGEIIPGKFIVIRRKKQND